MAKDAMKQTRLLVNNPREVSEQDAYDIYRSIWWDYMRLAFSRFEGA